VTPVRSSVPERSERRDLGNRDGTSDNSFRLRRLGARRNNLQRSFQGPSAVSTAAPWYSLPFARSGCRLRSGRAPDRNSAAPPLARARRSGSTAARRSAPAVPPCPVRSHSLALPLRYAAAGDAERLVSCEPDPGCTSRPLPRCEQRSPPLLAPRSKRSGVTRAAATGWLA
jgi:hypothetical protein